MKLMVVISFTYLLTFSSNSHAYIDPGSVSLAIQGIVAAVAGAALFWRSWFWRVLGWLGFKKAEPNEEELETPEPVDKSDS